MRGDVLRALIELITNADDAYNGKGGEIHLDVRPAEAPFEWIISIHDKAGGLTADGLKKAFSNLGDENQKFASDQGTRGLFGRGAKDVAVFGKARFHSISKGTPSYKFSPRNLNGREMLLILTQLAFTSRS
jgi:DNA topoisomerase VI subunit B